jgi:hypothetical protein
MIKYNLIHDTSHVNNIIIQSVNDDYDIFCTWRSSEVDAMAPRIGCSLWCWLLSLDNIWWYVVVVLLIFQPYNNYTCLWIIKNFVYGIFSFCTFMVINQSINLFIYFYAGFQTVGEEYVNIIMVNKTKLSLPSTMVWLFTRNSGTYTLIYILTSFLTKLSYLFFHFRAYRHFEIWRYGLFCLEILT